MQHQQELSAADEIKALIERSRAAQAQIENYTQEQVDELIRAMVWSVARPDVAEKIAQFTVDETQRAITTASSLRFSARPAPP